MHHKISYCMQNLTGFPKLFPFIVQSDKKELSLKAYLPEILAAAEQNVSPSMQVLQSCSFLPWKAVIGAPHLSYTMSDK